MSKLTKLLKTLCLSFILCLSCVSWASSQSSTANLSGTVVDANGAIVPGAAVTLNNNSTGFERKAVTDTDGSFTIPLLPPANYTLTVARDGFASAQVENVILNVGDNRAIRVELKVSPIKDEVIVTADASLVKTDASVGTVINRSQVENIPVNGRTIQTLIALTPGVTFAPQTSAAAGQFSVNGQRLNSNEVTVDGAAANLGISPASTVVTQATGGQGVGYTAQGTTAGLVSLDALQEFRIQTSTYSAEYGRVAGGQISLVTRSGENKFHGSVFELFRDDSFDANDWFANRSGIRSPLSQHMFGGTLSGPIVGPRFGDGGGSWLWNGKDRSWFFFSYEGLRLQLPKFLADRPYPTTAYRASAHASLQPFLNAIPLPNGADLGNGTALGSYGWSETSNYDATALKIDHKLTKNLSLFGRFSETPSFSTSRANASLNSDHVNSRTFTVGSTWAGSNGMANDLRVNFSRNRSLSVAETDTFGGASLPPPGWFGSGRSPEDTRLIFQITLGTSFNQVVEGSAGNRLQRQFYIADGFTFSRGNHTFKFGGDFRRLNPQLWGKGGQNLETVSLSNPNITRAEVRSYLLRTRPRHAQAIAYDSLSLYLQNSWRVTRRFTLDLGLRWEVAPPPYATEGGDATTYANLDNPYGGQITRNPPGTPLWKTRYDNFAPRFGASYMVSDRQGEELVLRGGVGLYYDAGYAGAASTYDVGDLQAQKICPNLALPECPGTTGVTPLAFPLNSAILADPVFGTRPSTIQALDPNLRAPIVYQYNIAVERSFGSNQTVSVSFVGSEGRRLLRSESISGVILPGYPLPASATSVRLNKNLGYSDYRALQVQFQRRMSRNIQAQVGYTWGRSRDTASADDNSFGTSSQRIPIEKDYGNSDFDVRHNFNAAVSLRMPKITGGPGLLRFLVNGWGLDTKFLARTGLPTRILATIPFNDPAFPLIENLQVRPSVVLGQPIWIENPDLPGGRQLNRLAFSIPSANTQGDLPRNSIYGFGARQIDTALRRDFALSESVALKFSVEIFNVTNTPNFINPFQTTVAALPANNPARQAAIDNFGRATQTLGQALGGLNPLYQIGGPRSVQFSAKLAF